MPDDLPKLARISGGIYFLAPDPIERPKEAVVLEDDPLPKFFHECLVAAANNPRGIFLADEKTPFKDLRRHVSSAWGWIERWRDERITVEGLREFAGQHNFTTEHSTSPDGNVIAMFFQNLGEVLT